MSVIGSPGEISTSHAWRKEKFRVLYKELSDDLWRYCRRRTVSDEEAEDVLAEVMLVAWKRLDDVPPGQRARPWLFGVARNTLRSSMRKRKRSTELTDRLVHEVLASPTSLDVPIEQTEALVDAFNSLKEKDQELIRLVMWDALPHVEIAEILGCSENAVAIRLHRARQVLADRLEKQS